MKNGNKLIKIDEEEKEFKIYKETEFETFIEMLETKDKMIVGSWVKVAEALGVDKDTVYKWKKHPRAKRAIADGIKEAMSEMQLAGMDDWKMWEKLLRMMGVKDDEEEEGSKGVNIQINIIDPDGKTIKGHTTGDGLSEETERGVMEII